MNRPRIKSKSSVPYGGQFVLNNPERGLVGKGTIFTQLVDRIRDYRKANAIVTGLGLEEEIEQELSKFYPAEFDETDPNIPDRTRRITITEAVQGTTLMGKLKLAGSPLVEQAEAERRAVICLQCPWNMSIEGGCGMPCNELKAIVVSIVGSKGTRYDDQLRSCGICACYLTAAVFVPLELQQSVLFESQKEKFRHARDQWGCWKGEGL